MRKSDGEKVKTDFTKSAIAPEIHDWDDPYWQERTPIALVAHALAHKHKDVEENHLSKRKEIISDIAPAIVGITQQDPALITFTALAGIIIYGLHAQAKVSSNEYDELLKIWAEYKNNCNDPNPELSRDEKKKYAEEIVKTSILEMNIKLTDIELTDTKALNTAMTHAEERAKKRGWIPPRKVTAQDVKDMDTGLKNVAKKYGKAITDNLVSPILDSFALYAEAAKSCISDLKAPKKAFNGIVSGTKTSIDKLQNRKETKQRRQERQHHKKKVKFIKAKTQDLPASTIIKQEIDYESAKRYSDIIKTIEEYNPEQAKALLSFGTASTLAGIGIAGLTASSVYAATSTNGLDASAISIIGAGIWGLTLGIGSWGQTGKNSEHYNHALNGKRALEATEHKSLARAYDSLIESAKNNTNKPARSALPLNLKGRMDVNVSLCDDNDNSPS